MITDAQKIREIERELSMRRKVYPKLVARGEMHKHEADRRIAVFESIAQDYRIRIVEPQTSLFDEEEA